MDCEAVREALSANDGRVLRGRKLRAHLRHCGGCRDFRAAIGQRRSDLASLAPPLPAAAAAGLLHALVGSQGGAIGAGAAGMLGGAGGKTLATSGAMKIGAAVVASVTIGVGTAEVTGVADAPFVGSSNSGAGQSSGPGFAPRTNSSVSGGAGPTSIDEAAAGNAAAGRGHKSKGKGDKGKSGASHGSPSKTHGSAGSHAGGPPNGVGGGRSFGQQTAASHASQRPPKAQGQAHAHPAPKRPAAASTGKAHSNAGGSAPNAETGASRPDVQSAGHRTGKP